MNSKLVAGLKRVNLDRETRPAKGSPRSGFYF